MVDQEARLSRAIEDYLKTIYLLQKQDEPVSTNLLAEQLDVKPASVSGMLKKLSDLQLVDYTPYYGVVVSPAGERIALEVLRLHRLIEAYLVQALGYTWDEVHAEAEALEHVISEKLEAHIAEWLGHPTRDPHGDPIPSLEGDLPQERSQPVTTLSVGDRAMVTRVHSQDGDRLRYLASLGIVPGATLEVQARAPFEGPLTLQIGSTTHVLDSRLAHTIIVEPERPEDIRD